MSPDIVVPNKVDKSRLLHSFLPKAPAMLNYDVMQRVWIHLKSLLICFTSIADEIASLCKFLR